MYVVNFLIIRDGLLCLVVEINHDLRWITSRNNTCEYLQHLVLVFNDVARWYVLYMLSLPLALYYHLSVCLFWHHWIHGLEEQKELHSLGLSVSRLVSVFMAFLKEGGKKTTLTTLTLQTCFFAVLFGSGCHFFKNVKLFCLFTFNSKVASCSVGNEVFLNIVIILLFTLKNC